MEVNELELPDPSMPACPWLQESWEAAGVRTDVPDARLDQDEATTGRMPAGA